MTSVGASALSRARGNLIVSRKQRRVLTNEEAYALLREIERTDYCRALAVLKNEEAYQLRQALIEIEKAATLRGKLDNAWIEIAELCSAALKSGDTLKPGEIVPNADKPPRYIVKGREG
jgi:hypothetical protein